MNSSRITTSSDQPKSAPLFGKGTTSEDDRTLESEFTALSIGDKTKKPSRIMHSSPGSKVKDKMLQKRRDMMVKGTRPKSEDELSDIFSWNGDILTNSIQPVHTDPAGTGFGRSTDEIKHLRVMLTDCQVQLKLQRDLLRQRHISEEDIKNSGKVADESDKKSSTDAISIGFELAFGPIMKRIGGKIDSSADLQTQFKDIGHQIESVLDQKDDMIESSNNDEISDLKAKLARSVEELKAEGTEYQNLLQQVQKYEDLDAQLKEQSIKVTQLQDSLAASKEEVSKLQLAIQQKIKTNRSLQVKSQQAHDTITSLNTQIEALETENEKYINNKDDDSWLNAHISFQTHAIRILSKLLDRKSIREAAEKVVQLANRDKLQLDDMTVDALRSAVDEYLLAAIEAVSKSRIDVTKKLRHQSQSRDTAASDQESRDSAESVDSTVPVPSKVTQLRLDELTRRWKKAEEALSFQRRQNENRLGRLEAENGKLRARLGELEQD